MSEPADARRRSIEAAAPIIEAMESRHPERAIARAVVDALNSTGLMRFDVPVPPSPVREEREPCPVCGATDHRGSEAHGAFGIGVACPNASASVARLREAIGVAYQQRGTDPARALRELFGKLDLPSSPERVTEEETRSKWKPPSEDRVPMNVHAEARDRLRGFLFTEQMRGVGYSEFIMRAIDLMSERVTEPRVEERAREVVAAWETWMDWLDEAKIPLSNGHGPFAAAMYRLRAEMDRA